MILLKLFLWVLMYDLSNVEDMLVNKLPSRKCSTDNEKLILRKYSNIIVILRARGQLIED